MKTVRHPRLTALLLLASSGVAQAKPAPAPADPQGRLKLVTDPAGATVSIDGQEAGKTPFVQSFPPGTYHVRLAMPGFPDVVKDIVVATGNESYDVETFARPPAPVPAPAAHMAAPAAPGPPPKIVSRTESKSGLEFVYMPGGTFHYGCEPQDTQCTAGEVPGRSATVAPFWIAKTDVTVEAYAKCVTAGACTNPAPGQRCQKREDKKGGGETKCLVPDTGRECNWNIAGKEHHPNNCINWEQATAFCEWIGGKLPTSEEWEYAAKGGESRIYPWGNDAPDGSRACYAESCSGSTAPTDSYRGGASRYGLLDMAGNVWQWTASREIRGGSWAAGARNLRASNRLSLAPSAWDDGVGARCSM